MRPSVSIVDAESSASGNFALADHASYPQRIARTSATADNTDLFPSTNGNSTGAKAVEVPVASQTVSVERSVSDRRRVPLIVGSLALGWAVLYLDRSILSPLLPVIGDEFELSGAQRLTLWMFGASAVLLWLVPQFDSTRLTLATLGLYGLFGALAWNPILVAWAGDVTVSSGRVGMGTAMGVMNTVEISSAFRWSAAGSATWPALWPGRFTLAPLRSSWESSLPWQLVRGQLMSARQVRPSELPDSSVME